MKEDGIPFSYFLGGSKKKSYSKKKSKKKSKKRTNNRKRKNNRKTKNLKRFSKTISKKCICVNGHCDCVVDKSSSTPEGLGYCPNCMPSRIIMRGRDDNLYKLNNKKIWELFD